MKFFLMFCLVFFSGSVLAGEPVSIKVGESKLIKGTKVECTADISSIVDQSGDYAGFKEINYDDKLIFALTAEEVVDIGQKKPAGTSANWISNEIEKVAITRAKKICTALGYGDRVLIEMDFHDYYVEGVVIETEKGKFGDLIEKSSFPVSISTPQLKMVAQPVTYGELHCGIKK